MRMRKKPHLDDRLRRQAPLLVSDPSALRGRWRELAPHCPHLWVELGCGKGRFTAETAAQNPDALLVAVERVPDVMVMAAERAGERGLTNVRFMDADAAHLAEYFAPGEVERVYLNFSDPWPSSRQAKRRLTHPDFLRVYARVLAPGGQIHFKTDNRDLFEWSLFQFPKAGFTLSEVTRDLHHDGIQGVMTDYEEKFHAMGTPINRCVATRRSLPYAPLRDTLSTLLSPWAPHPVTEAELAAVLTMLEGNQDYFQLDGSQPTLQSLQHDLAALPPRCKPDGKHYLALWRDGRPWAVLDVVEGYPHAQTLWIGLLLVDQPLRGQGLGRAVVDALLQAAEQAGFGALRLGCLQNNLQGHGFWQAVGFRDLRAGVTAGPAPQPVWIMERPV